VRPAPRLVAAIALWVCAVGGGLVAIASYELRSGRAAEPRDRWPEDSSLSRSPDRPTLLLFAHPHCPCTRASFAELEWIASRAQDRLECWVVAVQPAGAPADWIPENLGTSLAKVRADADGVEAARFDAHTSGQTLVYAPDGRLLFRGGITGSRGHVGENAGRDAVMACARGERPALDSTPVFGCSLATP